MKEPQVKLTALPATDGSASYNHAGYEILASVNGPLEVQRRDEIPNEVYLEVNVREASGVGGPRERHLESALQKTLRALLLTTAYPRALLQLTLQVVRTPEHAVSAGPAAQHASALMLQPHLINAAVCALLDGNIAMSQVAVAVGLWGRGVEGEGVGVGGDGTGRSYHVFAFSGRRQLLLAESEGSCSFEAWQQAAHAAQEQCCGKDDGASNAGLLGWLRTTVANEIQAKRRWQGTTTA